MASLSHSAPSRLTHLTAELYGKEDATLEAWHRVCVQAAEALGAQHAGERLTKALQLAKDGAVELTSAGCAVVTNGRERYKVQDGSCSCPDYANRGVLCKHALAVAIHRQALQPTAPAPAAAEPAAPKPKTSPRKPAAPASAAGWQTTEAPASCNVKVRVGHMELMYTARDTSDEALQARMLLVLPWYKELMEALEDAQEARQATKTAPAAAPPAAVPAAPASALTADASELHTLIQQAVQQALALANGHSATGTPPSTPPGTPGGEDQASGFCSLHQEAMELRSDAETGDTWYSHYRDETQRYCKGAKLPRRNGQNRR